MRIEVVPTVEEIRAEQIIHRTVIVIDVLRSTSTIVSALAHGCQAISTTETIGKAMALRTSKSLLAGERYCKKIASFDENNSPIAMKKVNWEHTPHLVLTTTNGTRAMQKAEKAEYLYIASFLNATACITQALQLKRDITLYCSGTRMEFALEDGLCAGLLVQEAKRFLPSIEVCDLAEALQAAYQTFAPSLLQVMMNSKTGKRLQQHHHQEDIEMASQLNLYKIVPVCKEQCILPLLGS
ncbi:2-phosphosulfolactate phosphatase [Brevibacillus laterosporus]|uniref:Probable 2-phosphosulfolactate phosphatase n=1 Tax=Brevibacillus laterosporus TaxID=1465 RepID=A0AAP8Q8M2_BRELA|nr:2-phosphosulfolactate phosphatase [Brevibacillus laterosporus]MCR8981515.1 2-phosphosulfolactate phosphatase [Brevibacillus laterosporus]MCZ0808670.1 2-phosphosulfolactate phosphatase [Brevibacillus laterosporus]MCZ0827132.1 2-phosphosulfolactate phosphatase [Brevibacillus laterosporus]MCZ0850840.1 2-phosphosulfolactate phosphatase [Brevibacillus laterosporus]MED1662333.1 2-phosphosulfolactate phosphatase [Brevibacillus laterosporus]